LEAAIVALVRKENAMGYAERAENAPSIHEADLARIQERLTRVPDFTVMEQKRVHLLVS
jgi:hypothetical protein